MTRNLIDFLSEFIKCYDCFSSLMQCWNYNVRFIFSWRKWLFWGKYSFSLNRKKTFGNEGHEKETKHILASVTNLLHIKIRNCDWCKCRHRKNEAREIECSCCIEVDAMLIVSAKILKCEGKILPSSFFGQLPTYLC